MTSVEIQLPDCLAQEAAVAGLFAPERIEAMFARQLQTERLLASLAREDDAFELMSMAEIQAEVDAVRAEKRAAKRRAARA